MQGIDVKKKMSVLCDTLLTGSHYTLNAEVPRKTVSFVFLRVLMFPETKSTETSGLKRMDETQLALTWVRWPNDGKSVSTIVQN